MSDTAKRTAADVVRDFWVWFVANGHTLLGSQVQAELVSRINYWAETQIDERLAALTSDAFTLPPRIKEICEKYQRLNEVRELDTDDKVIKQFYVSVPRDLKCHKCGAPEPWRTPRGGELLGEIEHLEDKP